MSKYRLSASSVISRIVDFLRNSLNATVSGGVPTLVYRDGSDFVHRWLGGARLDARPLANPSLEGRVNYSLFTKFYAPGVGDTVLDLGCGVGTELAAYSRAVGNRGRVIAVDASREACRLASKTVRLLGLKNVEVLNLGIADIDGTMSFPAGSIQLDSRLSSSNDDLEVVFVSTVHSLMHRLDISRVDLMKMNIEGSEGNAIFHVPLNLVSNTVISCHDFTGDPSQATETAVTEALSSRTHNVFRSTNTVPGSCEWFYVYSRRIEV